MCLSQNVSAIGLLLLVGLDCDLVLLQVPGAEGNFVFIRDAWYKKPDISKLPFPTYLAPEDEDPSELEPLVADLGEVDPFMLAE